jgi:hypothetical protein
MYDQVEQIYLELRKGNDWETVVTDETVCFPLLWNLRPNKNQIYEALFEGLPSFFRTFILKNSTCKFILCLFDMNVNLSKSLISLLAVLRTGKVFFKDLRTVSLKYKHQWRQHLYLIVSVGKQELNIGGVLLQTAHLLPVTTI